MRRVGIVLILLIVLPATVPAAEPPAPAAVVTLGLRHAHVTPSRQGFTHSGAGTIDVAQPTPDTLIVTMTGAAMAGPHPCKDSAAVLHFDLIQDLEIAISDPKVRRAKAVLDVRAVGLLRARGADCGCKNRGSAAMPEAEAALTADCGEIVAVRLAPHGAAADDLGINDHAGPTEAVIAPGRYVFHQTFVIEAAHARSIVPGASASAEFAPDPALDPLWLGTRDPFHGAIKKDLGFQATLKIILDPEAR